MLAITSLPVPLSPVMITLLSLRLTTLTKSKIARIRGLEEVTLTTGKSPDDFETMAASTIEECDRLLDMINTMLVISKTEAGVEKVSHDKVDIAALIGNACELF